MGRDIPKCRKHFFGHNCHSFLLPPPPPPTHPLHIFTEYMCIGNISEGNKSSTHYLSDRNRFDVSSKGPSSGISEAKIGNYDCNRPKCALFYYYVTLSIFAIQQWERLVDANIY